MVTVASGKYTWKGRSEKEYVNTREFEHFWNINILLIGGNCQNNWEKWTGFFKDVSCQV